ncbi:MAG TPA: carboxypeptidase regulatory-like domain-containing protein [Pyrinomonadaceae bacterium]|jgi:tetratricopeptide (TPR) repeat protein
MRRNYFLITFAALAILLLNSLAASAQIAQLRGQVLLQQADGTTVPLPGATVDVYRLDLPGKSQTKTDKQGNYVFAGLYIVGNYVVVASAPNARPDILSGVKVGMDRDFKITLVPGDGKRLTEAEVKSLLKAAPGAKGTESAEDRKKREELEAKNREIMASNEKNTKINEVINRTFKAGNESLTAKRYDEAINYYNEGLAADPEQSALLTNKSVALKARAVERYNAAVTNKDDAAKSAGMEAARKDFREAAEAATKAVQLVKAQAAPTEQAALTSYNANKYTALATRAEAMRLFITKVDPTQADAGLTAFQEYLAVETAADKKAKAQLDLAQMLLDVGAADKSYAEFQKVLADSPDNVDALLGAGLALFSSGDKTKYQDAANYLQRFVDKAPETHKFKADARAVLDNLKSQENIKPQKATPAAGRRRG